MVAYFQRVFRRSNRDTFWENEEKYMNKDVWMSFLVNLHVDIL